MRCSITHLSGVPRCLLDSQRKWNFVVGNWRTSCTCFLLKFWLEHHSLWHKNTRKTLDHNCCSQNFSVKNTTHLHPLLDKFSLQSWSDQLNFLKIFWTAIIASRWAFKFVNSAASWIKKYSLVEQYLSARNSRALPKFFNYPHRHTSSIPWSYICMKTVVDGTYADDWPVAVSPILTLYTYQKFVEHYREETLFRLESSQPIPTPTSKQ